MSRSTRSVRIPWYQRPLLKNNQYIDIQKGAMLIGLFAVVSLVVCLYLTLLIRVPPQFLSLFTIATTIFDIYCYAMAAPGSTHYGYYIISYEFVYVGNKHGIYVAFYHLTHYVKFRICSSSQHVDRICPVLADYGARELCHQRLTMRGLAEGKLNIFLGSGFAKIHFHFTHAFKQETLGAQKRLLSRRVTKRQT